MNNQEELTKLLVALEEYLKSVDEFQAGKKTKSETDSLDKLDIDMRKDKVNKKINPNHKSKSFKKLITVIEQITFIEGVVPYTEITKLIYRETKYNRELLDIIKDTLRSDWESYCKGCNITLEESDDEQLDTIRKFLKIKEHIGLSVIQRNHISDRLSEQLKQTEKKLKETDYSFKKLSEELEVVEQSAHEKADKLVVQFITILGIFAAIMMGAIGSFQGFTSIFSNAEKIPIGKTLIISAAGASGISLILFLLLHSISKLTSFPLSNCDCQKRKTRGFGIGLISETVRKMFDSDSEPKCTCSLFNKYPTIFIINYLFYYVGVTGFTFMYFNFWDYFQMNVLYHILVTVIIYIISTLILIIIHKFLINRRFK